jgi:RNA polymerase sigma-70 factor, ECF subfamily
MCPAVTAGRHSRQTGWRMPSNEKNGAPGPPDRDRGDLQESDDLLVRRARNGDPAAFDQLVLRHQDAVYGLVRRMVDEVETARELTQDAFVRAWRGLGSFRDEARFSTWIFRIAVNICLDHHGSRRARDRKRDTSLESEQLERRPLVSTAPDPARSLEEKRLAAAFREALEELDPEHRRVPLTPPGRLLPGPDRRGARHHAGQRQGPGPPGPGSGPAHPARAGPRNLKQALRRAGDTP